MIKLAQWNIVHKNKKNIKIQIKEIINKIFLYYFN